MSLWFITNTVGRAAAQVVASDTSDTATSSQAGISCVKGGPRHLKWTSDSATAARRISYVEKGNSLEANFCVIVDAAAHVGEAIKILEFTAYGGTEANIASLTLAESDLVGIGRQDYVYEFSTLTGKEGFGVEFTATDYEKTARQIFFGVGLEFPDSPSGSEISVSRLSIHEPARVFHDQPYHLHSIVELSVSEVTRSMLQSYMQMWKKEPLFIYDDTGTSEIGNAIEEKLWHCIILDEQIGPQGDDAHQIDLTLGVLRSW